MVWSGPMIVWLTFRSLTFKKQVWFSECLLVRIIGIYSFPINLLFFFMKNSTNWRILFSNFGILESNIYFKFIHCLLIILTTINIPLHPLCAADNNIARTHLLHTRILYALPASSLISDTGRKEVESEEGKGEGKV